MDQSVWGTFLASRQINILEKVAHHLDQVN